MQTQAMSLARDMVFESLEILVEELGLVELHVGGRDYLPMRSERIPDFTGTVRLFKGQGQIQKAVYNSLMLPSQKMETHMIFCFGGADSGVPHFTIDSIDMGEFMAFHLDLTPRVELGTHVAYMKHVYYPLTETFNTYTALEGLLPARLNPEQYALMSPWMLAKRASREAFRTIKDEAVPRYRDQFLKLAKNGVDQSLAGKTDLTQHDLDYRAALFSPEIDPVWPRVNYLAGERDGERLRRIMASHHLEGGLESLLPPKA
jgi:hypothetical protein